MPACSAPHCAAPLSEADLDAGQGLCTHHRKREALIRRIKALRQMTVDRGATEQQATEAMEAISRLMAEHSLGEDDLSLRRDAQGCVKDSVGFIRPKRPEWFRVSGPIAALTKTKVYSEHTREDVLDLGIIDNVWKLHFYGFPQDVAAALAMADIVGTAILQETGAFAKSLKGRKASMLLEFEIGMADRLRERIREMTAEAEAARPTGTALIVLKDQLVADEWAKYCRDHDLRLSKARYSGPVASDAYRAGANAANGVNLRPGPRVTNTAPTLAIGKA